jgi:hypothetical protein
VARDWKFIVKSSPTFYGTQRFIAMFTRVLHRSRSWAWSIQSLTPYPIPLRSIEILSTHLRLGLLRHLFPFRFHTNILYAFLFVAAFILRDWGNPGRSSFGQSVTCPIFEPDTFRIRVTSFTIWNTVSSLVMKYRTEGSVLTLAVWVPNVF